jgi:signal transduction histidine kinase
VTRDEAFEALKSGVSHERGQAARALYATALRSDLRRIRAAFRKETAAYVRTALQDVIEHLTGSAAEVKEDLDLPSAVSEGDARQRAYSEAVSWVTGMMLHEISAPIGLAILNASRELGDRWQESKTRRHLESVERIFSAMERLKDATITPRPQDFDLHTELADFVSEHLAGQADLVSLIGVKPFIVKSDASLVRFIAANAIRNAVEAVSAVGYDELPQFPVVVNWGADDKEYWLSVIDEGIGFVGAADAAFKAGTTTKTDHSGFGLAIAKQAADTLNGRIQLRTSETGGAVFEARWARR